MIIVRHLIACAMLLLAGVAYAGEPVNINTADAETPRLGHQRCRCQKGPRHRQPPREKRSFQIRGRTRPGERNRNADRGQEPWESNREVQQQLDTALPIPSPPFWGRGS